MSYLDDDSKGRGSNLESAECSYTLNMFQPGVASGENHCINMYKSRAGEDGAAFDSAQVSHQNLISYWSRFIEELVGQLLHPVTANVTSLCV